MAISLSLFAGAGAQFFDNNGGMLSGGLIYTYLAGTTTPAVTYNSNLGTVALANPIVLDSSGRIPTGEIWLPYGVGYKFVVKTATNVLIGTYDNIPNAALPPIVNDAASISYEPSVEVLAGNFIVGNLYQITSVGNTNFQLIGASSNTVGVIFTATGVGSGTGKATVSRVLQNRLMDSYSLKDFGGVCNGTTDDTSAWLLMAAKLPIGQTCTIPGPSLISSTITITRKIALQFLGGGAVATTELPASYILKKSTMSTVGLVISVNGFKMAGGGVVGQTGNTGNGITIVANNAVLDNVCALNCGGDGIRIGSDAAGINANTIYLNKPVCSQNTGHGIYIHDDSTGVAVDANACTIVLPFCQSNGGDGIRVKNAFKNTFVGCLTETNTGAGIRLMSGAQYQVFTGGDQEGNTVADIIVESGASWNSFINPGALGTFTDAGQSTTIIKSNSIQTGSLAGAVFNNGTIGASYSGTNECYMGLSGDSIIRFKTGWTVATTPITGLVASQVMACANTLVLASRDTVSGKVKQQAGTGLTAYTLLDPQNGIFEISGVDPKFSGTNSTGAGTPLFGTNSPATVNTAPYTWVRAKAADGTTIYIPAWK